MKYLSTIVPKAPKKLEERSVVLPTKMNHVQNTNTFNVFDFDFENPVDLNFLDFDDVLNNSLHLDTHTECESISTGTFNGFNDIDDVFSSSKSMTTFSSGFESLDDSHHGSCFSDSSPYFTYSY